MSSLQTQIKICGITCPLIAKEAINLGAHYLGLVFHPASKRYIENQLTAKAIAKTTRLAGGRPVAVCVDHSADEIRQLCLTLNIDIVQLHGEGARNALSQLPEDIIKIFVLTVGEEGECTSALSPFQYLCPERDFLLFDGPRAGSGERIVLDKLNEIARDFKFFVAGGLNEGNVEQVISRCHPFTVDVSSGVENSEGNKDQQRIKKFIDRVQRLSNEK